MEINVEYPVLQEPPYAHAITRWDEQERLLTYEYNGRSTISIHISGDAKVDYRMSSDGDLVSDPLVQQQYIIVDEPAEGTVVFHCSNDAICMRPTRAGENQAILGQVGYPLLYGVNGLYDINQDLLIDWSGTDWAWAEDGFTTDASGDLLATMTVQLGPSPWIINMKYYYYNRHLGYSYHTPWTWRPKVEPISGWCSWEAYRREVSEEHIQAVTRFVHEHFQAYGMTYIQLDDGFQPPVIPTSLTSNVADDWLSTNERFPSGHQGNIAYIKQYGLEAGIWIYTFVHNQEFARVNPGFIKDQNGEPIEGGWIGFIVDCLPETLDRYITPSFKGFKDLGYTYLKTDGLRHLIYDGLHEAVRRGLLSNAEAAVRFRRYVEYIRNALGEDIFYLSSWGVLSEMVGVADACRIGLDVGPFWTAMRMQMVEAARWYHTQRILFLNDPDHLCLRADFPWAQSAASLTSLSGGLFMLSDMPEEYDAQRLDLIKKCLPPLKTYTGETGVFKAEIQAYTWTKAHGAAFTTARGEHAGEKKQHAQEYLDGLGTSTSVDDQHPFSTLWAFHLSLPFRQWCVAGRFATVPLTESMISLESLGLNPEQDYLVFDFWAQQYLGCYRDAIPGKALEFGHCQLLGVCPLADHPQLLASSRHVSMDAVSVQAQAWAHDTLRLELTGVPGTSETYWVHLPAGYQPKACAINQQAAEMHVSGEIVGVVVAFHADEAVVLEMTF